MMPIGQPRRDYDPQQSRRDLALAAGFDPHPDDLLPPAVNQPPCTTQQFAEDIAATPFGCSDCNGPVFEDDMAPSCGAHHLCVPCYETSDFRCRECHRVQDEVNAG